MPSSVELAPGGLAELRDALDADHALRELGQHRRRVAGTGADFEHLLVTFEPEGLTDRGDHPRLRDGLLVADRQRRVVVGAVANLVGHEVLARHRGHRGEDPLVVDPATAQLTLHHPGALVREVRRAADA